MCYSATFSAGRQLHVRSRDGSVSQDVHRKLVVCWQQGGKGHVLGGMRWEREELDRFGIALCVG